MIALQVRNLLL